MKKWKRILSVVLVCAIVFPTIVMNSYADERQGDSWLFADDFSYSSNGLTAMGWTNPNNILVDETTSKLEVGKVGGTSASSYTYLGGNSAVLGNWENYTVEADVTITDNELSSNGSGRVAGLVVGAPASTQSGAKGYEFMLCNTINNGKQYCALKDRTGGSKNSADVACEVEIGKTYTLKMEVTDNQIFCYIDDKLMITYDYQGTEEHPFRGTIGLHGSKNIVEADNVRVWQNSAPWFTDNFVMTDLTENGWTNLQNRMSIDSNTGKLNLGYKTCGSSTVYSYLGGYPIAANVTNYMVEADVYITSTSLNKGTSKPLAAIIVGANTTNTGQEDGYQFLISAGGYAQLVDKDKTPDDSYIISGGKKNCTIEVGKTYNLKIVVNGKKIQCYLNNEFVCEDEYKGTDANPFAGLIGFRAGVNVVEVDNVLIRPITVIADNYYDISFYRNGRTTAIHPYKENANFYGWYEDAEFTKPLGDTVTTGNAYAKFVEKTSKYIWFAEDFNGTRHSGWNNASSFDVTDNKLVSNAQNKYTYLEGYKGAANWSNYTVEADVVVTDETIEGYKADGRLAGIVAGAAADTKTNGYEFMIVRDVSKTASLPYYYRLMDRTSGKALTAAYASDFELGKTYNLKMVLDGNTIYCYINDELKISSTVDGVETLTGTVGLHAQGNVVEFDNVLVYSNDLLSVERYNSANDVLTANGWTNLEFFKIENEKFVASTGAKHTYLNTEEANDWSNYTVEAEVAITDTVLNEKNDGRFASIAVAADGKTSATQASGYEFMISYKANENGKTVYSLKDREGTGNGIGETAYPLELNKEYTLTMEVNGNKISCYIDDVCVIQDYVVAIDGDLIGTIGLFSGGNVATFENLRVWGTSVIEDEKEDVDDSLWFAEYFDGTSQDLLNTGWNTTSGVVLTPDEQLQLSQKKETPLYLTGYEGASEWSNYTVEADVVVTDKVIPGNTAQNRIASLIVAANDKNKGYELMFYYNTKTETTFYQVKDRITGTDLTNAKVYPFELNTVANLKMVVYGNVIEVYIDGELENTITVPGVETLKGTIGIKGLGNVTYFDNVKVYEAKPSYKLPALTDVRGKQVWFSDDFSSKDSIMTERGWSKDYDIYNGQLYLPGNGTSTAYVSEIEKAYEWQDYTAQADVYVADIANFATTVQEPAAFLCVRSTSENSGYDLGVIWNAGSDTGWIRLRNRTTSTTLAEYKDVKIQKGQTYQLKVTVKGNQIYCYLDGELIITYVDEDNTNPVGTVGVRKSGYVTYFDNVAVYENGTIYSPATGDIAAIYPYIWMLCTSVCVGAVFVWKRKREEEF